MRKIALLICIFIAMASGAAFAASMTSYTTKATPVAADKFLITDSSGGATKNVTIGSVWDNIPGTTISATSPLCLDAPTGVFSVCAGTNLAAVGSISGNNKYFGTNSSGTVGTYDLPTSGATSLSGISDWPSAVSAAEVGYLDGVTSSIQTQINNIVAGSSGYISIAPTYSDSTCTKGTFATDSGYFYFCKETNTWDRISYSAWSNPSPIYYTLTITQPTGGALTATDSDLSQAINCGSTCSATAASGASITGITATADSGYTFSAWTGDCTGSVYNDGSVTMSANKSCSASFSASCSDSTCSGFLVCQNFEGAGYDNSETWVETQGTNGDVNEDNTTATVLRGSQQLKIYAGDSGQSSFDKSPSFGTDQSEIYYHFRFKTDNPTPSSPEIISGVLDSGANVKATVYLNTTGHLYANNNGVIGTATTSAISAGTMYHVWVHYKQGTANDGIMSVAFSTDATEPTSGTNFSGVTTGTSYVGARYVNFQARYQATNYFDQVLVRATSGIVPCN